MGPRTRTLALVLAALAPGLALVQSDIRRIRATVE
jgi:hypothetical protein